MVNYVLCNVIHYLPNASIAYLPKRIKIQTDSVLKKNQAKQRTLIAFSIKG